MRSKMMGGYNLFSTAVKYNSINLVMHLMEERYCESQIKNDGGYNLLQLAVKHDSAEVLGYLKRRGFSYEIENDGGYNLLQLAVKHDSRRVVECLRKDNSFNYPKVKCYGLFCRAVRYGAIKVSEYLISNEDYKIAHNIVYDLFKLACDKDHLEDFKFLLDEEKVDINAVNIQGETLLHLAAKQGHIGLVKFLVSNGANISIRDRLGKAPREVAMSEVQVFLGKEQTFYNQGLFYALSKKNLTTIIKLLSYGADINAQDNHGKTLLHLAAMEGCFNTVELLVERGANISIQDSSGKTPREVAVGKVSELLDDTKVHHNERLFRALSKKDLNTIKKMLDWGADINAQEDKGYTPLHLVAEKGHLDLIELLVERGANINAKDREEEKTLLHYAVINNKINLLKKLADIEGIDANLTDSKGFSPLYYAAKDCNIDALKELKKFKSINDRCPSNNFISSHDLTAFCCAIDHSKKLKFDKRTTDFLEELIDVEGVEINVQDQDGKTLLHYVAKTTSYCLVQKLLDMQNINLNIEDSKGMTPMHYAILKCQPHVVRKLAKARNINCDFLGDKGKKFLHRIVEFNQSDLLPELVKIINEKTKSTASVMKGVKISPIQHQMTHWV